MHTRLHFNVFFVAGRVSSGPTQVAQFHTLTEKIMQACPWIILCIPLLIFKWVHVCLLVSAHPVRIQVTFMTGPMSNCALQPQGLDELILIAAPVQTYPPAFKCSHAHNCKAQWGPPGCVRCVLCHLVVDLNIACSSHLSSVPAVDFF